MTPKRKYQNGITSYTTLYLPIHFPEEDVNCGNCIMSYSDSMGRPICRSTGKILFDIGNGIDAKCPLQPKTDNMQDFIDLLEKSASDLTGDADLPF